VRYPHLRKSLPRPRDSIIVQIHHALTSLICHSLPAAENTDDTRQGATDMLQEARVEMLFHAQDLHPEKGKFSRV
jgi:hypothetical protein